MLNHSIFLIALITFVIGWKLGRTNKRRLSPSLHAQEPSRNQLLSWLDLSPIGWVVVDGNNKVRIINLRAQRLLRLQYSKPTPRHLRELSGVVGLTEMVKLVREQQQPKRLDWSSEQQNLEIYALPGEKQSVSLVFQSRRSLEAQLNQQERWVSDVAHELKTPLTALLLVGDSLAARVTDQNALLVERLLKELRRMRELVDDLLELSRLENVLPGNGMTLERIDVESLLTEVWQGIKPLADQKEVRLNLRKMDTSSTPLIVLGHRQRLHRALFNLLDNALRYSPNRVSIDTGIYQSSDWVRICVRDYGPGLSEQDLEHMFERFYRGDPSRCRQQRGSSGLGLAIVHQIILAHGGWIFGENTPDGGACFELRLPLQTTESRSAKRNNEDLM